MGIDAGPDGVDAGPDGVDAGSDAGAVADAAVMDAAVLDGAVMDAAVLDGAVMDAAVLDGAMGDAGVLGPAARLRASTVTLVATLCGCNSSGFTDAAECSNFGRSATVNACDDMAYATNMAAAMGPVECFATARATRATCAASAGCDTTMLDACETAEDMAFGLCDTVPMSYGTDFQACLDRDVVGATASTCPENATASMMTGDAVFTGDTTGAGSDAPTASCRDSRFCDTTTADRAYQWTAPTAGRFVFDTAGSAFDTLLSITDGCAGSELACNDDALGMPDIGFRSRTELVMTVGQTVTIHLAGCSSASAGMFQININRMP